MTEERKMRIVALCGPKYCGKDTAAKGLLGLNDKHKKYLFRRAPMAEGVKRIVTEVFGIPEEVFEDPVLKETVWHDYPHIEPRWLLMDIANWMRKKYGGDVWPNRWERIALAPYNEGIGCFVITDLRFPEELEMLRRHRSLIIYVHRDSAEQALHQGQKAGNAMALNPSEAHHAMLRDKADVILVNDGSVEQLHNRVLSIVRNRFDFWTHWPNVEEKRDVLLELRTGGTLA
jgi:hypothetical protein